MCLLSFRSAGFGKQSPDVRSAGPGVLLGTCRRVRGWKVEIEAFGVWRERLCLSVGGTAESHFLPVL